MLSKDPSGYGSCGRFLGTLCALTPWGTQDNCLLSLEHLGPQPDLTVLRVERNIIDDFHGAERCPKLKEVRL
jgi:hypothetical protein